MSEEFPVESTSPKLPEYVLHVDGVAVDFDSRGVLPLQVRHWMELEELGIKIDDLSNRETITVKITFQFVSYVLSKCTPSVPGTSCDELVKSMDLSQLTSMFASIFNLNVRKPVNRPI